MRLCILSVFYIAVVVPEVGFCIYLYEYIERARDSIFVPVNKFQYKMLKTFYNSCELSTLQCIFCLKIRLFITKECIFLGSKQTQD